MGWKAIRDHYRIEHTVCVSPTGNILIGSAYVPDLITIMPTGAVRESRIGLSGDFLPRYMRDLTADPSQLRDLFHMPDTFARSLPVFTYRGGEIIEKQCEEYGWPNITHDGELMYENTFSADRDTVVEWAKDNAIIGMRMVRDSIADARAHLQKLEEAYEEDVANLASLDERFPHVKATERRLFSETPDGR